MSFFLYPMQKNNFVVCEEKLFLRSSFQTYYKQYVIIKKRTYVNVFSYLILYVMKSFFFPLGLPRVDDNSWPYPLDFKYIEHNSSHKRCMCVPCTNF